MENLTFFTKRQVSSSALVKMTQRAQHVLPTLVLDHYHPLTSSMFDKCTDNSTSHRDH